MKNNQRKRDHQFEGLRWRIEGIGGKKGKKINDVILFQFKNNV